MKNFYHLLFGLFLSTQVYSQVVNPYNEIFSTKIDTKTDFREINGEIWIRDSIYYYSNSMSSRRIIQKDRVISRDNKGRIRKELSTKLDSSGNMINYRLTKVDYYDNDILNDSLIVGWDKNHNLWNDTIYYLKKDIRGNTLDSIYSYYGVIYPGKIGRKNFRHLSRYNDDYQKIYSVWFDKILSEIWIKTADSKYFYDDNGQLINRVVHGYAYSDYDEIHPEFYRKYIYKYDINGNVKEGIWQEKRKESQEWKNQTKFINKYYSDNSLMSNIWQKWDIDNNQWVNDYLTKYHYQNNFIKIDSSWRWKSDNIWKLSNRNQYEYNSKDLLVHKLQQLWNSDSNSWYNNHEYIKEYNDLGYLTLYLYKENEKKIRKWINEFDNNNKFLRFIFFIGDENDEWEYWQQIDRNYYNDDKKIIDISKSWDKEKQDWTEKYKYTYFYDNHNNLTYYIKERKDENTNNWVIVIEKEYFWSKLSISAIIDTPKDNFILFPNPASDFISLQNTEDKGKIHLSIFDRYGKKITTEELFSDGKINISDLDNGIYFIKTNNQNKVMKVVVQHK